MPPIPSTPNDNNENEKKENVGDEMPNAVLERNTHPSNRATVSAGTGTVITMEVASGPKVDTYTYAVRGLQQNRPTAAAATGGRRGMEVASFPATP